METLHNRVLQLIAMALFQLLSLFLLIHRTIALPVDTTRDNNSNSNTWSKEAILTLLGVCTAIACFIIGLAWRRLRVWLCDLFTCQPPTFISFTLNLNLTYFFR